MSEEEEKKSSFVEQLKQELEEIINKIYLDHHLPSCNCIETIRFLMA